MPGRQHAALAIKVLRSEPFWQAQTALLGAVILYLSLPSKFVVGPNWLMPVLELLLIGALWFDRPRVGRVQAGRQRRIVIGLLGAVAISNLVSLELLVHYLLQGGHKASGHRLILSAVVIWLTNVAVFALGFWQIDRGGPDRRARDVEAPADFLFPQMSDPDSYREWSPDFVDYLYQSYTNSTALSPTDTMPMTNRVKLLMMAQSITSLVTVLLVAARAVNILQ